MTLYRKRFEKSDPYHDFALIDLGRKIAFQSDRSALSKFLELTIFSHGARRGMTFTEYIDACKKGVMMKDHAGNLGYEEVDLAADLTVDKFQNIPSENELFLYGEAKSDQIMNCPGPDCRYQFRTYVNKTTRLFKETPPVTQLEGELRAARLMQGLVRRHFRLSLLEAKRQTFRFWSRYSWKIEGHGNRIHLWLPITLRGKDRAAWLAKNIDDPCPSRGNERKRIQEIIYQQFAKERFVELDESVVRPGDDYESWLLKILDYSRSLPLANLVAEEKARNIHLQRPAINRIGSRKLKELILRIFNDLDTGDSRDGQVAEDFGLSKAAFSRFAGRNWQKARALPDLWVNTAYVLSRYPVFCDMAMEAGIMEQVQNTVDTGTPTVA